MDESVETVDALFSNWENLLLSDDRAWDEFDECVETDQCCWYVGRE
jgi:hypothetical protein